MENQIIVAPYIRVSTQEQAAEGYSIGEQTERLQKYCDAQNWTIRKIYSDPGFSGASIERPALQELISDIESGNVDKVLVFKLDRLSRSQKDTLFLIEDVFLKNHVDFVSMTENFDTATPFGKAMIGILSVFAQLEREQIKDRLMMGKVGRAKSGRYLGNCNIITGYDYIDGRLVVNEYYAEVVRRIFREFNAGRSTTAIANDLNSEGILTSTGCKWNSGNLGHIMQHREYIGEIEYAGEVYPATHEPIIDRETFDKAQARLENRRLNDEMYLRFSSKSSIVTGLCWCTHCHAKRSITSGSPDKNGVRQRFIVCRSKKEKQCPNPRVPVDTVEEAVLNQIRKLKLDPEFLQKSRKKSQNTPIKDQIRILENRISDNEKKIRKLTDLYVIDGIDMSSLRDQVDQCTSENTSNREKIEHLKKSMIAEKTDEEIISLAELVDSADEETLKIIVGSLIKRIDFEGDTMTINWTF